MVLLTRASLDAGLVYGSTLGLVGVLLMIATLSHVHRSERLAFADATVLAGASLLSGLVAYFATTAADAAMVTMLAGTLVLAGVRLALPRLTVAGVVMTAQPIVLLPVAAPWSYLWLAESGAPAAVLAVAAIGAAISALGFGFAFAETLARRAVLTHARWRRPTRPLRPIVRHDPPKVAIHLPAYAEPPELVIGVLDRLTRLDYPNFEVLVCDNNTPDDALWRPVQAHCRRLNHACGQERFRFWHVERLAGAKAGALNLLLDHTAPDADLVAVIDADYHAAPDFLSRLTGFFDDPAIGYVQTPHDYRGFAHSPYLRGCYWEYMPSNKVELPGVSEYGASYTIGTMCVIRRRALEAAGRWAEWCLTEDSEVSVRMRALGYEGVYLPETFGRGLIPETFDDFKKQRFRWTAGPVQQLRRHWRLYLPRKLGGSAAMGGWSKLLETRRGMAPAVQAIGSVMAMIAAVAAMGLTASGHLPSLAIPDAAWAAMAIGAVAGPLTTWQLYRLSGCRDIADMVRGEIARLSLTYVQMIGGIAGLSRRPIAWRRTPKFAAQGGGLRAIGSTLPEAAIGAGHLVVLVAPVMLGLVDGDLMLLVLIGGLASASRFLAAPVMALLSERHLARHQPVAHLSGARIAESAPA